MSAASFNHWSPLQTLLVWVLGACVAGVVWYALFYRDARDAWQVARNDLHAAEKNLEKVGDDERQAKSLAAELATEAQKLARERGAVPGGDGHADDPLVLVPGVAAATWLSIERWQPLPEEEVEGVVVRIPAQVDARGDWGALTEFLRRVEALPQIVGVSRLTIRPGLHPGISPGIDPGLRPSVDPSVDPGLRPSVDPGVDPGLGAEVVDAPLELNFVVHVSRLREAPQP
jgi:Tfp pilus assembly protein PilO